MIILPRLLFVGGLNCLNILSYGRGLKNSDSMGATFSDFFCGGLCNFYSFPLILPTAMSTAMM